MFNFKLIVNILGALIAINGIAILLALPFAIYYQGSDIQGLLISGIGAIILGAGIFFSTRNKSKSPLKKRDGYVIVSLGWIVMTLVGALPYVLSGAIPSFTDAFFESMSGFTTTGATILGEHIEDLPKGLHFWRAMTHWIGGMGIIVLAIAILPLLGIGGMQLFAAEVPGPTPDKLTPRVRETAKRLWIIYIGLTLLEMLFLWAGGMNLYESLCHSMATLSTGGFSTRQASVGAFSAYHQYVITVFMFLAGTNFALTYAAIRGKPITLWKNEEFRLYTYLSLLLIAIVSCFVFWGQGSLFEDQQFSFEEAFRHSSFQVIAIMTTTGFGTEAFTNWGQFMVLLFFVLMFSGACAGSTSGGMKLVRFLVVFKNSYLELKRQIHPKAILPVRLNGKAIQHDVVSKILAFFLIFVILFVAGSFVMTLFGLDFDTAIGSTIATLGNIGPGIGKVGPQDSINFARIPDGGKWFLSFLMLLGRLELFTVLMLFSPFFWTQR